MSVSNRRLIMDAINLVLFGFIVYTALIVVPSIWEELTAEGNLTVTKIFDVMN